MFPCPSALSTERYDSSVAVAREARSTYSLVSQQQSQQWWPEGRSLEVVCVYLVCTVCGLLQLAAFIKFYLRHRNGGDKLSGFTYKRLGSPPKRR